MTTATGYSSLVQELYIAYFGRPADYYGLQNFEAALAAANAPADAAALAAAYGSNAAIQSLINSFGTSAESNALYGSGSTESFVNAIFENLFDRPAAVSGLTFWVDAINSGAVTKGDAALAILAGAEPTSNSSTQAAADWALIQAKVSVATSFTTALGASSTQIVDYAGASAAQDARLMLSGVTAANASTFDVQTTINDIVAGNTQNTYNLTTGVDTLIGGPGNNTFNAILDNAAGVAAGGQAATLQSFDTITGGTLNNTLNITDFGTGSQMTIPVGTTITGITALNVNTLEGVNENFSSWTGLTALNINSADGTISLTVPNATVVNVNDTAGTISISGGSTVTAKTNTSNEIIVNGGTSTTAVSLTGGVYDDITDANHGTGKTNSITTVSLTANGVTGQYSYTTIDSDALTTLSVTNEATGVYIDAAAGTRTLTVNLDGDGPGYVSSTGAWIEDNTATTLVVNAVGNASDIYFQANSATSATFNDAVNLTLSELIAPDAKAITITGAGNFTADLSGAAAAAAINAADASGVVTVTLAGAGGQSFAGGSGQDIVSIGGTQTGIVTGGSATDNEIVLNNAGTATVADIASVTHFSIFGVAGNTQGVFDMSKVSGYDAFDVQSSGGNVTFTNAATGSSLSLENGNNFITTLQTIDTTGASDSVTVTLNTGNTTFESYQQITLEDSNFVGTATVNLVNNQASNQATEINILGDQDLVTLNVTGTGSIYVNTWNEHSASLTINNSSVSTTTSDSLTFYGLTDNNLTSLTLGGSQGIYFEELNTTATTLTITDNNASSVYFGNFSDTALKSATFTNSVNTTAATFIFDSTLTEPSLATLTLSGNVELAVTGDTVATGITVTGGTDNANVDFTGTEVTASGSTDSITLGNGVDHITLGAGLAGSTQTVVLGSGAGDQVTSTSAGTVNVTVGSAATSTDTITANSAATFHATAGNGTNVIADSAAGASIAISVGTGANTITVGADTTGTISLGTHTGTDALSIGASGTSLTAIEKISGLNNSTTDTLTFSGDATTIASVTQVTAGSVIGSHGDTTLLADWVAAATGATGSAITGTAHTVVWFQYQGNTYLVETVGADTGSLATGDTLVELTGTSYTFAHASSATNTGGVLHFVG